MKRHAYLITAYEDRRQLEQLLSLLDDARNDIYLQVDSNGTLRTNGLVVDRSALTVLPPFPIFWGGYSFIQAQLDLLAAASRGGYHYYHVLTGSDLPLVSQDRVHERLENSDIEYVDFTPEYHPFAHWKAAYYHLLVEHRLYRRHRSFRLVGHALVKIQAALGVDRSRRSGESYYHGSSYFSITHGFAEYILTHQPWVKRTFHHTLACDEVYVQTLLMKSPFRGRLPDPDSVKVANLRHIDWKRREKNSPRTFRMVDYDALKEASQDCLFARKFRTAVDREITDTIVRRLTEGGAL